MTTTIKTCAACGKAGCVAGDQTDPAGDELALDSRGVVARNQYVCGECLERAEDFGGEEDGQDEDGLVCGFRWC